MNDKSNENKSNEKKRSKKGNATTLDLSEQDRKAILRLKTGVRAGACKSQNACKVV